MRSSFFVLLSVFVHALCVAAIAVSPSRRVSVEGTKEIEVQVGQPAEQPGVEQSTAPVTKASEPITPAPVKVAKASTRKTRVMTAPMEKVSELPKKEAAPVVEDSKLDPEISEEPAVTPPAPVASGEPEFVPVKESAPAGVEAGEEESSDTGSTEAQSSTPGDDSELAHGGATKAGAVSYLDLKQSSGNKAPVYPMSARREARQGQVELVYRVTKEGKVADLQIAKSSGFKDLDLEAARAVALFKFVPGQEGWARHPVSFNLKGNSDQAPSKLRSAQTE